MNIWAPLPNDTNTIYVQKVVQPLVEESLIWSPDPGVRCRFYGLRASITTSAVVFSRAPVVDVVSGSDILFRGVTMLALAAGSTRGFSIFPSGTPTFNVVGTEYLVGVPVSGYIIHGISIRVGLLAYGAGDQVSGGVVYIDCWNDMSVRV